MKKSIIMKYEWKEDKKFMIVLADGMNQREIVGRDIESLRQGFREDL